MRNEENALSAPHQERAAGIVIDDIWSSLPNVHLRVLTAENESVEIQICDCGMSGQCLASAIAAATRAAVLRSGDES